MTASRPDNEAIFHAARDMPDPDRRREYVREACGGDEALRQLEAEDPRKAELVKLRFFAGLTAEQAAAALGVSTSTAEKDWAYARSWLRVAIDRMSGHRP